MSLKELTGNHINIADLRPAEERAKGSKDLFRDLKNTCLHNRDLGLWNREMREEQSLYSEVRCSRDQLLGVLVLDSLFGKNKAREKLDYLETKTSLYDRSLEQWVDSTSYSRYRNSRDQLLGVLITERLYGEDKARKQYESLKNTAFYDGHQGLWIYAIHDQSIYSKAHYIQDQLLGVLITEKLYGREKALEKVEYLSRRNDIRDDGSVKCNLQLKEQSINFDSPYTYDQLMTVLVVERLFGKDKAREKLEYLEKTPRYDKELQQWNLYDGRPNSSKNRSSGDQLLGILIRKHLEEEEFSLEKREAVPEVKNF